MSKISFLDSSNFLNTSVSVVGAGGGVLN